MRSIKRSIFAAPLTMAVTVGAISIAASGVASASGSENNNPSAKTASPAKTATHPSDGVMNSRMAPTQTTTGTGKNPDANSVKQATRPATGNDGKSKMTSPTKSGPLSGKGDKSDSTLPRMAPTQNTQGSGNNPKANS